MQTIYKPKGKAREYSPLAANIYKGCDHGCLYCYVPGMFKQFNKNYNHGDVQIKPGFIEQLKKDCIKLKNKNQVLICFSGDPYCMANDEHRETRKSLLILLENEIPVRILTKGGMRCLQDIEIFKQFGKNISIGATLTFINESDSKKWEPGAALPEERMKTLKILHENNIKTWASLEPVIDTKQSLELMGKTIDFIDEYKIGKLNNYKDLDKKINWSIFLQSAIDIMEKNNKEYYIKYDLSKEAPYTEIKANHRNLDYYNLLWIK